MITTECLMEKLCCLFSAFPDCNLTVLPFGEDSISAHTLWIVPDGDETVTEYVAGVRETRTHFLVKLRHRGITAAERLNSIKILESVVDYGRKSCEGGMRITVCGTAKHEDGDGAYRVFSLPIEVGYLTTVGDGDVFHYISFGGGRTRLGAGVLSFGKKVRSVLCERRFIHDRLSHVDVADEGVSFDFEFESEHPSCAMTPIREGITKAEVLRSYSSGEAELYSCILTEYAERDGICRGVLSTVGDVKYGTFDRESGYFTEGRLK